MDKRFERLGNLLWYVVVISGIIASLVALAFALWFTAHKGSI